jgi:dienelactone hydrolase
VPLPFLPSAQFHGQAYREQLPPIIGFERALADVDAVDRALIHLENIRGPILFLAGDADAVWPADHLANIAVTALGRAHHRFADEVQRYPNAGHWFFEPYIPIEHRVEWQIGAREVHFGGTDTGNAQAAPAAYERMLDFLRRVLMGATH